MLRSKFLKQVLKTIFKTEAKFAYETNFKKLTFLSISWSHKSLSIQPALLIRKDPTPKSPNK